MSEHACDGRTRVDGSRCARAQAENVSILSSCRPTTVRAGPGTTRFSTGEVMFARLACAERVAQQGKLCDGFRYPTTED